MTTQEATKRILSDDCHYFGDLAEKHQSMPLATLYERHIKLYEQYLLGTRVLH